MRNNSDKIFEIFEKLNDDEIKQIISNMTKGDEQIFSELFINFPKNDQKKLKLLFETMSSEQVSDLFNYMYDLGIEGKIIKLLIYLYVPKKHRDDILLNASDEMLVSILKVNKFKFGINCNEQLALRIKNILLKNFDNDIVSYLQFSDEIIADNNFVNYVIENSNNENLIKIIKKVPTTVINAIIESKGFNDYITSLLGSNKTSEILNVLEEFRYSDPTIQKAILERDGVLETLANSSFSDKTKVIKFLSTDDLKNYYFKSINLIYDIDVSNFSNICFYSSDLSEEICLSILNNINLEKVSYFDVPSVIMCFSRLSKEKQTKILKKIIQIIPDYQIDHFFVALDAELLNNYLTQNPILFEYIIYSDSFWIEKILKKEINFEYKQKILKLYLTNNEAYDAKVISYAIDELELSIESIVEKMTINEKVRLYKEISSNEAKEKLENNILNSDISQIDKSTLNDFLTMIDQENYNSVLEKIDFITLLKLVRNDIIFQYVLNKFRNNPDIVNSIQLEKDDSILLSASEDVYEFLTYLTPELKCITHLYGDNFSEDVLELIYNDFKNGVIYKSYSDSILYSLINKYGLDNIISNINDVNILIEIYKNTDLDLADIEKINIKNRIKNSLKNTSISIWESKKIDFFQKLDYEEQIDIIQNFSVKDNFFTLLEIEDEKLHKVIIDSIIQREDIKKISINKFNSKDLDYFCKNTPDKKILSLLSTKTNNQKIISEIMTRFNKNYLFFADASLEQFSNLELSLQEQITNVLKKKFNSIITSGKYQFILESNNAVIISKFLQAYENNLINDEILNKLYSKNKYAIYTINYELFDENITNLGYELIEKMSKYPELSEKLIKIYNTNPIAFNIFEKVYKSFKGDDYSLTSSDIKTIYLLEFLSNDNNQKIIQKFNLDEFTENDYQELMSYIIRENNIYNYRVNDLGDNDIKRSIIKVQFDDFKEYRQNLNSTCDELMKNCNDVTEAKNILLNKYFDLTIEELQVILDMYSKNFDSVSHYDNTGSSTNYINLLRMINEISDLDTVKSIYYDDMTTHYSAEELVNLEGKLKKIYAKSLLEQLDRTKNMVNSQLETGTNVTTVDYNGKLVKTISMTGDYNLLVNSTAAYGEMKLINNSFLDSWNLSERTKNHGICCSLIGNNMLGMAKVKDSGVMFGFYGFSDEALSLEGPYDIFSSNDGYAIESSRMPNYVSGNDIISNTRHTHNEIVIERVELREGDYKYTYIQPDYLVYTSVMSEKVKQNTLQAASEMDLPILYIDVNYTATNEANKITNALSQFSETKDLTILSEVLDNYESNRSGMRMMENYNFNDYISKETIQNAFIDYIDYLNTLEDKEYVKGQFSQIKEIILKEKSKFDIVELITERKSVFDIDYQLIFNKMEE